MLSGCEKHALAMAARPVALVSILWMPPLLQGHIPFAQSRVDTARIARRKAATAAILARGYNPPSAPPLAQPVPSRGLHGSGMLPQPQHPQQLQQQQQQAAVARARAAGPAGQQSLLSFGFTVQQRSPAVSTGPESMDME